MTNDATRATAEALPEINRRRFLLNTTMAGAAVAVTAPAVAAEPEMTPLEKASWHLRELDRLIMEDGGTSPAIIAVAKYDKGVKGISYGTLAPGRIRNDDDMFTRKGGAK